MLYTAHQIIENLYQGGFPPIGDSLSGTGFDVLVLAAWENQDVEAYDNIEIICAPGEDISDEETLQESITSWRNAAETVAQRVQEGKKVLVTCLAGQNRSGIISAMAVCLVTGCSGADAVKLVRKQRPLALNNQIFAQYVTENF